MADLLTHVLVAFVLLTVVGWRLAWLSPRWVAVGMAGSIIPDLDRLDLIVPATVVESATGLPFDWGGIHTLGGVVLVAGALSMAFAHGSDRRRGFVVLLAGGLSHLAVDVLKGYADGLAFPVLYPLAWWRPPTPSAYVSSDPIVLASVLPVALLVAAVDRYLVRQSRD